ncbi:MAG TPA: hypothetical protein VJW23_14290 [Propionibacteriaceae bacterium]|nr:hypothetical protein [Propionibacteriaceae bacterium]
MSTETAAAKTVLHSCACIRLGSYCGRMTYKTWAPGHDAKAKSLLQTAHRNGEDVVLDGEIMSARSATDLLVPALTPFLYYKRGTMPARFADDAAAMAHSAITAQIQVGRWTYNALIAGSRVTYVTRGGDTKVMDVADAKFVA